MVQRPADGRAGRVEVRLGAPHGTLAGTVRFGGTSSPYPYETVTTDLSVAARGRQDVRPVLGAGPRPSTFSPR